MHFLALFLHVYVFCGVFLHKLSKKREKQILTVALELLRLTFSLTLNLLLQKEAAGSKKPNVNSTESTGKAFSESSGKMHS